jgi:hypothetical protein
MRLAIADLAGEVGLDAGAQEPASKPFKKLCKKETPVEAGVPCHTSVC